MSASLPARPVLVRTWFGGPDEDWADLVTAIGTPSEDGFLAGVAPVDDPAHAGLDAAGLVAAQPNGAITSFLADERTLTDPERPILAVRVLTGRDPWPRPFRVVPAELWSVENNINESNMDWEEFADAVGPDGVFRGFG